MYKKNKIIIVIDIGIRFVLLKIKNPTMSEIMLKLATVFFLNFKNKYMIMSIKKSVGISLVINWAKEIAGKYKE